MDTRFADAVLSAAVAAGNKQEELQKHLDSLDAAGQEAFINESAQALGVAAPQAPSDMPGVGEALARGAARGATGGWQPELSALAEQGMAAMPQALGGMDPQNYQEMYGNQTNAQLADPYRQENMQAEAAHPVATAVGQMAGMAPALVATGGNMAAGAALGGVAGAGEAGPGNRLEGAVVGAGMGAAATPGTGMLPAATMAAAAKATGDLIHNAQTEDPTDKRGFGQVATDAALGGVLGAAGAWFGNKMTAAAGRGLQKFGEETAIGSAQIPLARAKKFLGEEGMDRLARALKDERIAQSPSMLKTVQTKVQHSLDQVGTMISESVRGLDEVTQTGLTKTDFLTAMENKLLAGEEFQNPTVVKSAMREVKAMMSKIPDEVVGDVGVGGATQRDLKPSELWGLAKALDKASGKYATGGSARELSRADVLNQVSRRIRGELSTQASALGADAAEGYRSALSKYGVLKEYAEGVDAKLLKRFGGKTSIEGFKAATIGSQPVRGGVTAVSNLLGTIIKKPGKYADVLLNAAARGPTAANAVHYVLQKTDPKYQEMVQKAMDEEALRGNK